MDTTPHAAALPGPVPGFTATLLGLCVVGFFARASFALIAVLMIAAALAFWLGVPDEPRPLISLFDSQ